MDLVDPRWAGRCGMARPLTGTTRTHVAALFATWGEDRAKSFVDRLLTSEINWEGGNATLMRSVGAGAYAWGFTDTDDANVSRINGHPTGIVIPDQGEDDLGTLVIPNSVMLIQGAKNPENGKKLIDFLLSVEVEEMLAEGRSAQIPLHPEAKAPEGVLRLADIKAMEVDWRAVGRAIETFGPWLDERVEGGGETAGEKGSIVLFVVLGVAAVVVLVVLGTRRRS
jgi:iron(III) transport system substrate-binding protein